MIPPGTGQGAWVPEGIRESSVQRDGAVDPHARLADMDLEGIDVAVLYGVVSLGFYAIQDRELAVAVCRAYNDWLADYCSADPARLKGTPALPLASVDDACAEAARCRHASSASCRSRAVRGGPSRTPTTRRLRPLYALAEELDVPIGLPRRRRTIRPSSSSSTRTRSSTPSSSRSTSCSPITTVVCGGVLERLPAPAGRDARSGRRLGAVLRRASRRALGAPSGRDAAHRPGPQRPTSTTVDCSSRPKESEASRHAMHTLGAQASCGRRTTRIGTRSSRAP